MGNHLYWKPFELVSTHKIRRLPKKICNNSNGKPLEYLNGFPFELVDKLPEALATRCAKCTERQKSLGKQLAQEVQRRHPDIWSQLIAHYDPQGKYQEAFQDYLKP